MGVEDFTREAVRNMLITHPGIKQIQIAERLGINRDTVSRHIRAITEEWARKDGDAGK